MMGKIVGGITDAVGLTNHKGEAKAQKASAAVVNLFLKKNLKEIDKGEAMSIIDKAGRRDD